MGCVLAGAVLAFGAMNHADVPGLPLAQMQAFADAHDCVWVNDRAVLLLADADTPRDRDCPVFVDGFGQALLRSPEARDREAVEQLRRSDAALVVDEAEAAWPRRPATLVQRYLLKNFIREPADFAPLVAWTRRP